MWLSFCGMVLNTLGSLVIVFTPLIAGYGGPVFPARLWQWRLGWVLMIVGFILQAVATYKNRAS